MGEVDKRRDVEIHDGGAAAETKREPDPARNRELRLEGKTLEALHIVRCQEFTEYDPKREDFIRTRFCAFNIAFFDLDKESRAGIWPPLHEIPSPKWKWVAESSVNVISLKIVESVEDYPISVFGTIIARDEVDYRCVYLFRRERGDSQVINSPEDMLLLTDPCRGLSVTDSMFFEINLKIKGDGGAVDKNLSKGVIAHDSICHTWQPMTSRLTSWLSTVELTYTPVPYPVEATLAVNILKGPCNSTIPTISRVTAWTTGNEIPIILYDSESAGTQTVIGYGGSIALTRHLVAVPLDEELVVNICFLGDDEPERIVLAPGDTDEEHVRKKGSCELQVKVTWRAIQRRTMRNMWETVGFVRLLR